MKSKIESMISQIEQHSQKIGDTFTDGLVDGLSSKFFPQTIQSGFCKKKVEFSHPQDPSAPCSPRVEKKLKEMYGDAQKLRGPQLNHGVQVDPSNLMLRPLGHLKLWLSKAA